MRWYDREKLLGKNIDRLKHMDPTFRRHLVTGILRIIRELHPTLLDENVDKFPLDHRRRRWYDRDPELWLIINGLKFAEQALKDSVAEFMEEEYQRAQAEVIQ